MSRLLAAANSHCHFLCFVCREGEGPSGFWWALPKAVEEKEVSLRTRGHGEQLPRQQQHLQREHAHRGPDATAEGLTGDSSDYEAQGQQQRQQEGLRNHRYADSERLQPQLPRDSDDKAQAKQPLLPEAQPSGEDQVQQKPRLHSGGLQEPDELSESDWSEGEASGDEGQADAATSSMPRLHWHISPKQLEGSTLPMSAIYKAVSQFMGRPMRTVSCSQEAPSFV